MAGSRLQPQWQKLGCWNILGRLLQQFFFFFFFYFYLLLLLLWWWWWWWWWLWWWWWWWWRRLRWQRSFMFVLCTTRMNHDESIYCLSFMNYSWVFWKVSMTLTQAVPCHSALQFKLRTNQTWCWHYPNQAGNASHSQLRLQHSQNLVSDTRTRLNEVCLGTQCDCFTTKRVRIELF